VIVCTLGSRLTTSPDFAAHRTDQTAWCPATAQAVELVRALRRQLREMTARLGCVERQDVTRRNGRARAMRLEAAALRRDIREAQVLIDRLHRRYLNGSASPAPVNVGAARRIDRRTHQPHRDGVSRPATSGQAESVMTTE